MKRYELTLHAAKQVESKTIIADSTGSAITIFFLHHKRPKQFKLHIKTLNKGSRKLIRVGKN